MIKYMLNMPILSEKVALITGASRGIGYEIARRFEQEGARLILTARENVEMLKSFSNAEIVSLDLSKPANIQILVDQIVKEYGRIDILVNNAAVFKQTDFLEISEEELNAVLSIDLKGPFLLMQRVFRQMMLNSGGKIINIASGAGILGSAKAVHYAAAKAGIINITKSLAKLGGKFNININAIAPGFVETDMIKDMLALRKKEIEAAIPLGRVGSAKDIASAVLFLASESSNYITGQVLCVDGGHCMV